jgi:fructose-1,6-bisphosphatase II
MIQADRNLAVELVRATEAGAMGAARWIGHGDKVQADQAAVDAMRAMLDTVQMNGVVVIGEGEKDEAPMLYNGERVGSGTGPEMDIAVDPLEGTELTASGQANAISIIAACERGTMFFPGPAVYMEKIAVGPSAVGVVDLDESPSENVRRVAEALNKRPNEVSVVVLNRERHRDLVANLRTVNASVVLIPHGDTEPAIAVARLDSDVDMVMGIGGTPEGVLAAAALRCLGGEIVARLWPRTDEERSRIEADGLDPTKSLKTEDLVGGEDVFIAATGVTTGALLRGVSYRAGGAVTESITARSRSGTVRRIHAEHTFEKLERFTGRQYR